MIYALRIGIILLLAAFTGAPMLGDAHAQPYQPEAPPSSSPDANAVNDKDFLEYKSRLFRLIREFRRYRTTASDIKSIMGVDFGRPDQLNSENAWIVGVEGRFKSLRMNHRVALYYDPVRFDPARGKSTIRQLQFETQYYVNFAQAEPPMALYKEPARCLTVAELEAALTAANLQFKVSSRQFITVGYDNVIRPNGMALLATAYPNTVGAAEGSRQEPDLAHACIESVDIS